VNIELTCKMINIKYCTRLLYNHNTEAIKYNFRLNKNAVVVIGK